MLWQAVKIAKYLAVESIPRNLCNNRIEINVEEQADAFSNLFHTKVENIIEETRVEDGVYNGRRKLFCEPKNFMTKLEVYEAMKTLKNKSGEGYDRIPQRILLDGADILVNPMSELFSRIYNQKSIPEQ